jgi:hypothetical protein
MSMKKKSFVPHVKKTILTTEHHTDSAKSEMNDKNKK